MNRFKTLVLSVCMVFLLSTTAQGATLGPAADYAQLLELTAQAADGDIILIAGEIVADEQIPLSTQAAVTLTSADTIRPPPSAAFGWTMRRSPQPAFGLRILCPSAAHRMSSLAPAYPSRARRGKAASPLTATAL